jgi:nitroreductase
MRSTAPTALIDPATSRALLEAATAAPSVHNSQPWLFEVGPRSIDLYADIDRQLKVADASGRSLLISCGAALLNLRVAADHLGFHPRVRLMPTPADLTHVARVDVDHRHDRPGLMDELYPAIWSRRTNRYPFWHRRIPRAVLGRMGEAVALENAILRVYDEPAEVERIVRLLRDAEFEERRTPGVTEERQAWVARSAPGEGIPRQALGPRAAGHGTPFRDLDPVGDRGREVAPFEQAPTVALLSTVHDAPVDWVRSGQALQRALLVATNEGVSASFMNQPLEQPDLRWLVRSPLTGRGHTQMILRLGYGVPVPATPRRPISQVLRTPREPT